MYIYNKIDSVDSHGFLWANNEENCGFHNLNWGAVTANKAQGGLRMKSDRAYDTVLLGKLRSNLMHDLSKLWVRCRLSNISISK